MLWSGGEYHSFAFAGHDFAQRLRRQLSDVRRDRRFVQVVARALQ